jgi:hypothetical protein
LDGVRPGLDVSLLGALDLAGDPQLAPEEIDVGDLYAETLPPA